MRLTMNYVIVHIPIIDQFAFSTKPEIKDEISENTSACQGWDDERATSDSVQGWDYDARANVTSYIPVNAKHLYNICTMLAQCRRRWADVVQMLYKCFVFVGIQRCQRLNVY